MSSSCNVYVCGINTNGQILIRNNLNNSSVVCCPTPIIDVGGEDTIHYVLVCFTHIFWRCGSGWRVTGYKHKCVPGSSDVGTDWKIYGSENRTTAITSDGALLVWEGKWRTLHFQSSIEEVEQSCQHHSFSTSSSQYEHSNVREKTEDDFPQPHKLKEKPSAEETVHHLGNADSKTFPHRPDVYAEKYSSSVSNPSFSRVAVEDNALLALRSDGVVLSGQVALPLKPKVKEVAVGKEHCMALTEEGEVYSWGCGMHGQLANGELCTSENPLVINTLQGIRVTSIACGAWHCVAQSTCGDVYVWGWNESGQLGFPPKSHTNLAMFDSIRHTCQCPGSKNGRPLSHQCGHERSSSRREDSDTSGVPTIVPSEGGGKWDDPRINRERNKESVNVQASPRLLDFWSEAIDVTTVVCGDRHTLFVLEDGSAWAAGMNRFGQLGLGHTRATEEPTMVLRGVTKVFAGGWNSVFVTNNITSPQH